MKLLITNLFVVLCASICVAQVPEKKTDLTIADREAWHKVLRWPA